MADHVAPTRTWRRNSLHVFLVRIRKSGEPVLRQECAQGSNMDAFYGEADPLRRKCYGYGNENMFTYRQKPVTIPSVLRQPWRARPSR